MAKFRAMLGDQFIDVEARDDVEAQNMAFAKFVRSLRPQMFIVWESGPADEWKEERSA